MVDNKDDTILIEDENFEDSKTALEKVKNFNPCGGSGQEYNNPTAGIAISTAATALISAGMAGVYTGNRMEGTALVLIGVAIYFIKAILMKKNCL